MRFHTANRGTDNSQGPPSTPMIICQLNKSGPLNIQKAGRMHQTWGNKCLGCFVGVINPPTHNQTTNNQFGTDFGTPKTP